MKVFKQKAVSKIKPLINRFKGEIIRLYKNPSEKTISSRFIFFDVGFHGDLYLLELVNLLLGQCNYFIETGANVGSTCAYVARKFSHIQCFSCEPDVQAFQYAKKNTANLANLVLYNETSQEFFSRFQKQYANMLKENLLFWLDAHGEGFAWPLKEEMTFITQNFPKAYILIDDFKVPGLDCFEYDIYQDQECSFEYIKYSLNPNNQYSLYYPNYTKKTSAHHPLRGWGLIEYGYIDKLILPGSLHGKVRIQTTVSL